MRELVVAKRSHLIAGSSIQGLSDILLGVHTTAEASELMERLRKWQDARVKRTRPHEDFTLDSDAAILALGEELTKPSVRAVYSQAAFSGGGAEKARRRVEALEAYSDEMASVGVRLERPLVSSNGDGDRAVPIASHGRRSIKLQQLDLARVRLFKSGKNL